MLATAGEVHLERCVSDLRRRFGGGMDGDDDAEDECVVILFAYYLARLLFRHGYLIESPIVICHICIPTLRYVVCTRK